MAERDRLPGDVSRVDALAATVGVTPVDQPGDAERLGESGGGRHETVQPTCRAPPASWRRFGPVQRVFRQATWPAVRWWPNLVLAAGERLAGSRRPTVHRPLVAPANGSTPAVWVTAERAGDRWRVPGGISCWVDDDHVGGGQAAARGPLAGERRRCSSPTGSAAPTADGRSAPRLRSEERSTSVRRRRGSASRRWSGATSPGIRRPRGRPMDCVARVGPRGDVVTASRIVVVDRDDGSPGRGRGRGISVGQPRFSPDGRRLAYVSDESGYWNVVVADADGTDGATGRRAVRSRGARVGSGAALFRVVARLGRDRVVSERGRLRPTGRRHARR